MGNKKQKMRFSDSELEIIKQSFAGSDENNDLPIALRKLMLQMPLDPIDEAVIRSVKENRELLSVLRKTFLPTLDPKAPLHQILDLWMTVTTEFKDKTPDQAIYYVKARKTLIEYLDQQLSFLETGKEGDMKFSSLIELTKKSPETVFSNLWARSTLLSHIETQLAQLVVLGGKKEETLEDTLKRLERDSSK